IARQNTHRCRFAGAIWAEETENLAPLDAEVEIVDRGDAAIALGEVLDLNQWRSPCCSRGPFPARNLIDVSFRKPQRPCHQPPILIERPRLQQEAGRFCWAFSSSRSGPHGGGYTAQYPL